MAGVNKVILVGNLGKDPEVQYLEGGIALARFSIATSERYKTKDGNLKEDTEWHNVVLWRQRAEIAEKYLKKGSKIYLEGKLRTRSWDDQDGNKKYTTEIVGDNFQMLDRKGDNDGGGNNSNYGGGQQQAAPQQQAVTPQQQQPAKAAESTTQTESPKEYEDDLPF